MSSWRAETKLLSSCAFLMVLHGGPVETSVQECTVVRLVLADSSPPWQGTAALSAVGDLEVNQERASHAWLIREVTQAGVS